MVLQPGEDPFGEQRKEKKARLANQEGRQLKNKQASDKIHGKPVLPPTLKLAASLPEHGKGVPTKRRELKADVSLMTARSSLATISDANLLAYSVVKCMCPSSHPDLYWGQAGMLYTHQHCGKSCMACRRSSQHLIKQVCPLLQWANLTRGFPMRRRVKGRRAPSVSSSCLLQTAKALSAAPPQHWQTASSEQELMMC